jgi:hypothetical protein
MHSILRFQKIYFAQLNSKKFISSSIILILIIYISTLIDVGDQPDLIYKSIVNGNSYQDFSFLTIIRFLVLHLTYVYGFSAASSFSNNAYLYLAIIRLKSRCNLYYNSIFFSLILSILYWGIAVIILVVYLSAFTLFNSSLSEIFFLLISKETMLFCLLNMLTSFSLINIFILVKAKLRKETLAFGTIVFLLIIYIYSFFIFGKNHFLFLNTGILTVYRTNLFLLEIESLVPNLLWFSIQNLIIGYLNLFNLKKLGVE